MGMPIIRVTDGHLGHNKDSHKYFVIMGTIIKQQDAKIRVNIIAQNPHYLDNCHHEKHHHHFLPTFTLSHTT